MRVALFFDGKNFYENLERAHEGRHHLNYGDLASWLVERVGGRQLTGAHYYTGIPDHLDPALPEYQQLRGLMRFLDSLEYVEGFFVYRFPRVRRVTRCSACNTFTSYTEEKEVDTSMVADMIRLAAGDAFDVLILASGDADHSPAVEAVRAMGKVVYLACWGDEALSPRLRRAAYGHIDLLSECPSEILGDGMRAAIDSAAAGGSGEVLAPLEVSPETAERVLEEVVRAQQYFEGHGGYLGRGYFIHRWRGRDVPTDVSIREAILDQLVEQGQLEEVQILGETALRGSAPGAGEVDRRGMETQPYLAPQRVPPKRSEVVVEEPAWLRDTIAEHVATEPDLLATWESLQRAEVHFRFRGFVGRGYFLTKWRDPDLSSDTPNRERLLTRLIELGVVEQYNVGGNTALRTAGQPPAAKLA